MEEEVYIEKPPFTFSVKTNTMTYNDMIIGKTIRTGGDYKCVTISYKYQNNTPISASIPLLSYEPECAVGSSLQKGTGTETLIKTAISYAYSQETSVPLFTFDDTSHIDCFEIDLTIKPPRKQRKPLNLAYLSIAYYGKTWYERTFHAKMSDETKYARYRNSLSFLTDPSTKVDFRRFLELVQPTNEQILYLEQKYNSASTYREFFNSIPRSQRCDQLFGWINPFMRYYLADVFSEKGWVIDARLINTQRGGSTRKRNRASQMIVYNYSETSHF